MTGTTRHLEGLHRAMDAIRARLDAGDFDALPGMIADYDIQVKAFCALPDARAHKPAIRELYESQKIAIGQMQRRQVQLQGLLRQQRQSNRAAQAYASTGAGR